MESGVAIPASFLSEQLPTYTIRQKRHQDDPTQPQTVIREGLNICFSPGIYP
jgi:hypothetical protein